MPAPTLSFMMPSPIEFYPSSSSSSSYGLSLSPCCCRKNVLCLVVTLMAFAPHAGELWQKLDDD